MDTNNIQNPAQTNFIPNPLPVPKRHEKRELGYDRDVPSSKMHYDVVVNQNDDFDI